MSALTIEPAVPPAPKITPNKPDKTKLKPVVMMASTPMAVINNTLVREEIDPTPGAEEGLDDLPLNVLKATVDGLNRGLPLGEFETHAKRMVAHATDKAELVAALVQAHELDRLVMNMDSRALLEGKLHRAIRRGDLTSAEALTFLDYLCSDIGTGIASLKKNTPTLDSITIIEKVSGNQQEMEKSAQTRFAKTTPQGREIIRRSGHAILKAMQEHSGGNGSTGNGSKKEDLPI